MNKKGWVSPRRGGYIAKESTIKANPKKTAPEKSRSMVGEVIIVTDDPDERKGLK